MDVRSIDIEESEPPSVVALVSSMAPQKRRPCPTAAAVAQPSMLGCAEPMLSERARHQRASERGGAALADRVAPRQPPQTSPDPGFPSERSCSRDGTADSAKGTRPSAKSCRLAPAVLCLVGGVIQVIRGGSQALCSVT